MANIRDVAALAGVSVGAVSRVLSQDPTLRVSDETRQRVVDAAASLEYVPSYAARALRTSRAGSLALVLPEVTSAVVAAMVRGVEVAAGERGVNVVLARAARLEQDEAWLRSVVGSGRVDGVILQLPDGIAPERIQEMLREPVPLVLINSAGSGPVSTAVMDDHRSMRPAVRHLHELGHRSIGFIGGRPNNPTAVRRREGFLDAMREFGLVADAEEIMDLGFTGVDGRRAAQHLIARGLLPTALVVANVDAAMGVLAELHKNGVRVPDDISLIALHDVWYADATWPPITTVTAPMSELGAAAVALLLDDYPRDQAVHRVVDTPAFELTVRSSTASPRSA